MNMIILGLGFLALFLVLRHIYCAYKFDAAMRTEDESSWRTRGTPKPMAFSSSDIKRFKANNQALLDSNPAIHRSVVGFERSWKYAMPAVLVLFVAAALLQKIFPHTG
jgi:hypothetical protein